MEEYRFRKIHLLDRFSLSIEPYGLLDGDLYIVFLIPRKKQNHLIEVFLSLSAISSIHF